MVCKKTNIVNLLLLLVLRRTRTFCYCRRSFFASLAYYSNIVRSGEGLTIFRQGPQQCGISPFFDLEIFEFVGCDHL
jgi:hypothetical protein